MNLIKRLNIFLYYNKVGSDEFGNQYFISKKEDLNLGLFRRMVSYNGIPEASKVPALWHAWLHYITNDIPKEIKKYSWQKEHIPNVTGTAFAYSPLTGEGRAHYNAWKPRARYE